VLHVAHHALPHAGGLEKVVDVETSGLAARGWSVSLLTSATGASPGLFHRAGVRVTRVRAWNGLEQRFGVPFPVHAPGLVRAAFRSVRRADLVHIHDVLYLTSWVAAFWCRVLGRPYVVHRHVGFVHHPSRLVGLVQTVVLRTVARLVLDGAAAVLAIDDHVAATVARDPGSRTLVLRNGVDTEGFRPAASGEREDLRRGLGLPLGEPLVLFVGRFVPKKGFSVVVAAASDTYRLVLVGGDRPPGTDDGRLSFLGARPADEMPAIFRCVDAVVVASVGECPLTVLEALSSGVPVIANDDPALHTPWTDGPGVAFADMGSATTLREALEGAVGRLPALRHVMRAERERVRASFSWEVHLDELARLYAGLLDGQATPQP